ncbi:MAG TPA: OmpA family protein [Gemmatimonadaceae bacterium]|jgi:peptidoglycan-associated lipoprotein
MRSKIRALSCVAFLALAGVSACHHAPPPAAATPAFTTTGVDAGADRAARERAAADAARRDSIARANARADSLRRAAAAARAAEDARHALLAPVHFEFDRDDILSSETALLERKAEILRDNPSLQVRIEGNADERGSDEYNLALGMRRAAAVERYIQERGIPAARMTTASNGLERPLCTEREESCWSRNRRDEVVITAAADHLVP